MLPSELPGMPAGQPRSARPGHVDGVPPLKGRQFARQGAASRCACAGSAQHSRELQYFFIEQRESCMQSRLVALLWLPHLHYTLQCGLQHIGTLRLCTQSETCKRSCPGQGGRTCVSVCHMRSASLPHCRASSVHCHLPNHGLAPLRSRNFANTYRLSAYSFSRSLTVTLDLTCDCAPRRAASAG